MACIFFISLILFVRCQYYIGEGGKGDCSLESRCSFETALGKCLDSGTADCVLSIDTGNYIFPDQKYTLKTGVLQFIGESPAVFIKSNPSSTENIELTQLSSISIKKIKFSGLNRPLFRCNDLMKLTISESEFKNVLIRKERPLIDINVSRLGSKITLADTTISDIRNTGEKNTSFVVFSIEGVISLDISLTNAEFDSIDSQAMLISSTSTVSLVVDNGKLTDNKQGVFDVSADYSITFSMKNSLISGNGGGPAVRLSNGKSSTLNSHVSHNVIEKNVYESHSVFSYFSTDTCNLEVHHEYNNYTNNECTYIGSGVAVNVASDSKGNPKPHSISFVHEHFFKNEIYGNYGGALVVSVSGPGELKLTDCTFEQNSVTGTGSGGALSLSDFDQLVTTLTRCTFTSNTASQGGAIYVHWSLPSTNDKVNLDMTLDHTNFYTNEAVGVGAIGGAVYMEDIRMGNVIHVTAKSCVFEGQSSSSLGGVVGYRRGVKYTLRPVFVTFTFSDCSFHDNFAELKGGAIYTEHVNQMNFTKTDFTANSARKGDTSNILYGDVDENTYGGAVYLSGETDAYFMGGKFWKNSAGDYGGALFSDSISRLGIYGTRFLENRAEDGGGNMFIVMEDPGKSSFWMRNNVLVSGGYANYGAGMVLDIGYIFPSSVWEELSCSVFSNDAFIGGGGVYFEKKYFTNLKAHSSVMNISMNTVKSDVMNEHSETMSSPQKIVWGKGMVGRCDQQKDNMTYNCVVKSVSYQGSFNETLFHVMKPIDMSIQIYNYNDGSKVYPIQRYEEQETSLSQISFTLKYISARTNQSSEKVTMIFSRPTQQWTSENVSVVFWNHISVPKEDEESQAMYWWAIIIGVSLIVALFVIGIVVIILVNEYIREYSSGAKRRRRKQKQKNKKLVPSGSVNSRYVDNMAEAADEDVPLKKDFEEDVVYDEVEIDTEKIEVREEEEEESEGEEEEEEEEEDGLLDQPPVEEEEKIIIGGDGMEE